MQNPVWRGSHSINRALRFDNVWPTLDIFKGNDTDIFFAAKTSGPNVVLDEFGFELANVDLTDAKVIFAVSNPDANNPDGSDSIILVKTNGSAGGIVITDAVNGKMIISISKDDFVGVTGGIYNCEVAFADADDKVHTLAKTVLNLIHSIVEGAFST